MAKEQLSFSIRLSGKTDEEINKFVNQLNGGGIDTEIEEKGNVICIKGNGCNSIGVIRNHMTMDLRGRILSYNSN